MYKSIRTIVDKIALYLAIITSNGTNIDTVIVKLKLWFFK